ncbi:hypothetical protein JKP88DRAFT_285526 [Tribonema minus]|uniref:Uncharacterized protein n=1 Tax=Tribonema minus TaxID=303371 RepID=A0A835ZC05_9STRA|nr:hypothetical protein JKP88DRAFT_285526 [Tribonema minus]
MAREGAQLLAAREEAEGAAAAAAAAAQGAAELRTQLADAQEREAALLREASMASSKGAEVQELNSQVAQLQEALSRATKAHDNHYRREALSRAMRDSGMREDGLQEELRSVRARWREALARCEAIQSDAHAAAAPLLRQASWE